MIPADVKSNIKQQQIKDLEAVSYKLLEEVLLKFQIQQKGCVIFI